MNRKVEDLQLLRGVAIALVICGHLSISSTLLEAFSKDLAKPFYWGVELFFVLSGYVVTSSLRSKSFNVVHFAIKRIFRLYPAILALLFLGSVINAVIRNSTYSEFMRNLFSVNPGDFMAQGAAILGGYFINIQSNNSYQFGAMWSLSVEFQFYAFSALLIAILPRTSRAAAYCWTAAAVILVSLAYRVEVGTNLFGIRSDILGYVTNWKFDFMAAGVLLAYSPKEHLERALGRLTVYRHLPFGIVALVTCSLMFVRHPLSSATTAYDSLNGIGMLITLAGCVFLVACGSVGAFSKSGAFRSLRHVLVRLGDVSYTVYLLHFPVMIVAWILINEYVPNAFSSPLYYGFVQLLLVILILFPVTRIVYREIELVGIDLGDKILEKFPAGAIR